MKYVAYIRVSTQKQGRSGLGLEAQKAIIEHNAGKDNIVAWYEEIHSGKNLLTLPILIKAKEYAKINGYVLILAKTDRLRNTQQALDLVDEMTPEQVLFCNVGRNADKFTLTLFFAFAEKERLEISIRTKAALAIKKAQGVKLGRPSSKIKKEQLAINGRKGAYIRKQIALNDYANLRAFSKAIILRKVGKTYKEIAEILSSLGYSTPYGKEWIGSSILRLLRMYDKEK